MWVAVFPLLFFQLVRFQLVVTQFLLWVAGFPLLFVQLVKCQCVQLPVEGSLPPRGRWSPPPCSFCPPLPCHSHLWVSDLSPMGRRDHQHALARPSEFLLFPGLSLFAPSWDAWKI